MSGELTLPKGWDLNAALELIRILQPRVREFNYHMCLGGSVLNKGFSEKDVDLYFMPMESKGEMHRAKLIGYLTSMWGEPTPLGGKLKREPPPGVIRSQRGDQWYVWDADAIDFQTNTQGMLVPWYDSDPAYADVPDSVFDQKLKFMRGEDRIDCFIC